jgi:hypothetical protein
MLRIELFRRLWRNACVSGDDAGARFHDEFMTARRASLEVRSCGFL